MRDRFEGSNYELVHVNIDWNSEICEVEYKGKKIGEWVEEIDKKFCNCDTWSCYKSKRCMNNDMILMRQFDYISNSDNGAVVLIFNPGFGKIVLMKCKVIEDPTAGKKVECEPPKK